MEDMYIDMGGSAAVMGTMFLVSKLLPGIKVHGVVGACENMTGADAYRPSDVITMYSGKTVEVLNTDAEGRLVLADCLHYVSQLGVDCVVDLATLTGACMVALGPNYAGLFSDDEAVASGLIEAATEAGENLWRMPLDPKLADSLRSKRADITNLGGRYGGAITAAQFLQNFKGETPWAHIDLAGLILSRKMTDISVQVALGLVSLPWVCLSQEPIRTLTTHQGVSSFPRHCTPPNDHL